MHLRLILQGWFKTVVLCMFTFNYYKIPFYNNYMNRKYVVLCPIFLYIYFDSGGKR